MRADSPTGAIVVFPAAAELRRAAGPTAWVVLEELLAHSTGDDGDLVVVALVRSIAATVGIAKDTAARALARLRRLGLIEHTQDRSATGVFAAATYRFVIPTGTVAVEQSLTRTAATRATHQSSRPTVVSSSQLSLLEG